MELNQNRVIILGANGYIGVALYKYLEKKGFEVFGIDNEMRERNVVNIGGESLTRNSKVASFKMDIATEYKQLKEIIESIKPATVVNLAQQPSAPFSMIDAEHAVTTQTNNNSGNLNVLYAIKEVDPNIHIIQLGTAGEYPDWLYNGIIVPEGSRVQVKYGGKDWTIPTPRYAGSWYHFSKLHSSYNADYACRIWDLRITDINQGIVYGHVDGTRFDYDEYFGTVINRFVVQAVAGIPLTVYGDGGQQRSFIHIQNALEAIELLLRNPAKAGEYRIIQQLTDVKSVWRIAKIVQGFTGCEVQQVKNPRSELPANEFVFEAQQLKTLGLKPVIMEDEIQSLLRVVEENKKKIITGVIMPKHSWK